MEIVKRRAGIKYREKFYLNGKEIKSPFFDRKTDAKTWKVEMLSRKSQPELLVELEKAKITFGEVAGFWLQKVKVKNSKRTYECYESVTRKHLMPHLKDLLIKDLNVSHGEELIKRLKRAEHNQKGVNIILAILKRILNDALERELIDKNSLIRVKPLKEQPRHETYWTKLEISQFLRANLNDPYYELYVVALNSGMRRGELAGLCWDRVDFE